MTRLNWRGAIFAIGALALSAPAARAQTLNLYGLAQPSSLGEDVNFWPQGTPVQGRDGNIYGLLSGEGNSTVVYQATPSGTINYQVVIAGSAATNGVPPNSCLTGMILGNDGSFYGTCGYNNGGTEDYAFRFTLGANGTLPGTFTPFATIHAKPQGCIGTKCSSSNPNGLFQASDGNFYGTTTTADLAGAPGPLGWVFRITPAGVVTVMHVFKGETSNDAAYASGPLTEGANGYLFGVSSEGGTSARNNGTLYRVSTKGTGDAVVYSFLDESAPSGNVLQAPNGNFYGTSTLGGANGAGFVFEVTPAGVFTDIHDFTGAGGSADLPTQGVSLGPDGNFYGMAQGCATSGCATGGLFKLTPSEGYDELEAFPISCGSPQYYCLPNSGVLMHTSGALFSVLEQGSGPPTDPQYNGALFQYIASPPLPAFISPQQNVGAVGATIGILGQGFTKTENVKFNGTSASFTVISDTFLTATVPTGATSGQVTVHQSPNLTLHSPQRFTVN